MKLFVHLLRAANRARVTGFGWAWEEDHIWDGQIRRAVGHSCSGDFGSGVGISFSNLQLHGDFVQTRQSYDSPR